MRAVVRSMLLLGACLTLSACGSLLPSERAEVQSPFLDYQDAQSRYNQVDPGKTTKSQLYALGFDPLSQGNAKMLSFIDVRLLFVQPNIPIDYLPDGLVTCLQAKDRCIGYASTSIRPTASASAVSGPTSSTSASAARCRAGRSARCSC